MAQYTAKTVRDVLNMIERGKLILPSMQRNFVWEPRKICDLFDSLVSGYPIGTFLFWEVGKPEVNEFVFNRFLDRYDDSAQIQRGSKIESAILEEYLAVLDGQQRITSINIGVNGSMHLRKRKGAKTFVDKYLALDVFYNVDETSGEATNHYNFDFLSEEELEQIPIIDGTVDHTGSFWIKVNKIVDYDFDEAEYVDQLDARLKLEGLEQLPVEMRGKVRKQMKALKKAINDDDCLSYYTATNMTLPQVVDVFVRVNSGGQKLSASDLMLSIASGDGKEDAQTKINEAILRIRQAPKNDSLFPADKDLVIRAGLMFTGSDSLALSKKGNYTSIKIKAIFEDNWDSIVESLVSGVRLLQWLGFGVANISKNLLLPVAYYLYKKKPSASYYTITGGPASEDKLLIKQWVIRAIVKSLFRDGTGGTLLRIRGIIDSCSLDKFPLESFLGSDPVIDLRIGDESIDAIMRMTYTDAAVRPLLAVLAHSVDVSSCNVDHMWPKSVLSSKRRIEKAYPGITETECEQFKKKADNITNLQLLPAADNIEKSDKLYDVWLKETKSEDKVFADYCWRSCVDPDSPTGFSAFLEFTSRREAVMRKRIKEEFSDDLT